ncbi:MAG: glycosyltransferase family 4 protein [Clostridia bacterium]|nr:glycosyltransferase family 4 protein [Clostridia bacterium]
MTKKLIAILTNSDDDIYCFRKELIERLINEGCSVLISCPYGEKFELMEHIDYIYDNPVIDRRGTNIINDYKLFYHYCRLLKKYRPDVILTYTAKPNVYASIAAKRYKIPYINNVTGLGSVLNKVGLMKRFILSLFKAAYSGAACVMFQNSENMKLAVNKKMVNGPYRLIPGSGVNTERYPLQLYPDGGNGIIGEKIVFNYIGRILRDKGVDDYIAAAKAIKAKYPNTEFNMIGFVEPTEQHYEGELEELGKKGIVFYRGNQKDVRPFIARSHAIIHPSTYGEGMSNVLLENASSGRVIITTDNPGCRETVEDGKTGFVYSGGNVNELVSKIELFLSMDNSSRQAAGKLGREKMINEFSREKVISAYLEEIERL